MKERFIQLLSIIKHREIPTFIEYLSEETDFFIAPASTKYHGSYEGGLLEHSLQVYDELIKLHDLYYHNYSTDINTLIIAGLLHDVCKCNFYEKCKKPVIRRDASGNMLLDGKGKKIWDESIEYSINDKFPIGHGEKSVIIIQRYFPLSNEEIAAINWHMAGFDSRVNSYAGMMQLSAALQEYPLITLLHMADLASINLQKKEENL